MDLINKGFDPVLLMFLKNNAVSLGLLFSVVYGIAKATPWPADEVLIEVVWGPIRDLLGKFKSGGG